MIRLIAALIVTAVLVIATVINLLAKPLNARSIVCVPVVPIDMKAQRYKGVQKV